MPRGIPGSGPTSKGTSGSPVTGGLGKRLIAMVVKSTQADLDEIDKEIKNREAELIGLKSLRECVADRVLNVPNGRPAATPIATAIAPVKDIADIQKRVLAWMNRQGPATEALIKKEFGIPDAIIANVMECKLFTKKFKTWEITADGYAALELAKDEQED